MMRPKKMKAFILMLKPSDMLLVPSIVKLRKFPNSSVETLLFTSNQEFKTEWSICQELLLWEAKIIVKKKQYS